MPVPELAPSGALPPGVHHATLEEIEGRYATNFRRREIFDGLKHVVEELTKRGVTEVWINGSFVTDKPRPGDADVIFEATSDYGDTWGLFSLSRRKDLKKLFKIDLLPTSAIGNRHGLPQPILEFFQQDDDDKPKGILKLDRRRGST